jgi:ketosteroid isomerase-like protein
MSNHVENEKLIRRYFDAMARKDFDSVWTCYAEDIVYEDAALGHVYNGLKATQEFYLKYMTALDVVNRIETLVTTSGAFGIGWRMARLGIAG